MSFTVCARPLNHGRDDHDAAPHSSEIATPRQRPSCIQATLWVIVIAASAALSLANYDSFQLGVYQDDASYVVLAESLLASPTYGLLNVPGAPQPTRYPFGFPLLIAPFIALAPDAPENARFLSLLATLVNSALLFWAWPYLSRAKSYWWGLSVAALVSLAPITVSHTRMVMSEPAFTTFVLLGAVLSEYARRRKPELAWMMLMSMTMVGLVFVRTIGLMAVVAMLICLALDRFRNIKLWLMSLAGAVFIVVLVVAFTPVEWTHLLPLEYLDQFTNPAGWNQTRIETPLIPRSIAALHEYAAIYLRRILTTTGGSGREIALASRLGLPFLPSLIGFGLLLVITVGFWKWFKAEGANVFLFTAVIYFIGMLLWPWRDERFLYPIQPQLFLGFLLGMTAISAVLHRVCTGKYGIGVPCSRAARIATSGFVVVWLAVFIIRSPLQGNSVSYAGDLQARSRWIAEHTSPDAVVMSEQPQVDFIYGKRRTVDYPVLDATAIDELRMYLVKNRISHILFAPELKWRDAFTPALSARATDLLSAIHELERRNVVQQLYASERDGVAVFGVRRIDDTRSCRVKRANLDACETAAHDVDVPPITRLARRDGLAM